jgi:hypothetical protein
VPGVRQGGGLYALETCAALAQLTAVSQRAHGPIRLRLLPCHHHMWLYMPAQHEAPTSAQPRAQHVHHSKLHGLCKQHCDTVSG